MDSESTSVFPSSSFWPPDSWAEIVFGQFYRWAGLTAEGWKMIKIFEGRQSVPIACFLLKTKVSKSPPRFRHIEQQAGQFRFFQSKYYAVSFQTMLKGKIIPKLCQLTLSKTQNKVKELYKTHQTSLLSKRIQMIQMMIKNCHHSDDDDEGVFSPM